MNKQKQRETF